MIFQLQRRQSLMSAMMQQEPETVIVRASNEEDARALAYETWGGAWRNPKTVTCRRIYEVGARKILASNT